MEIREQLERLLGQESIDPRDIPGVELYMDQVIRFMETRLEDRRSGPEEKLLTRTMVNNYVKSGLVEKPDKKRYNARQMMLLIMIYHMKNVLALGDLKLFLEDGDPEESVEQLYRMFLEVQEEVLSDKASLADSGGDRRNVMKLVLEADLNKRLAETMIRVREEGRRKDRHGR